MLTCRKREDDLLRKPFQKGRHTKVAHRDVATHEYDRYSIGLFHNEASLPDVNYVFCSWLQVFRVPTTGRKPETDVITWYQWMLYPSKIDDEEFSQVRKRWKVPRRMLECIVIDDSCLGVCTCQNSSKVPPECASPSNNVQYLLFFFPGCNINSVPYFSTWFYYHWFPNHLPSVWET
jgi:hypothetical protein